jgi:hypothetical protein
MKISTKCDKILVFTLEFININELRHHFNIIAHVHRRNVRSNARPVNNSPLPGQLSKYQCPGVARGGWAMLELTDALVSGMPDVAEGNGCDLLSKGHIF